MGQLWAAFSALRWGRRSGDVGAASACDGNLKHDASGRRTHKESMAKNIPSSGEERISLLSLFQKTCDHFRTRHTDTAKKNLVCSSRSVSFCVYWCRVGVGWGCVGTSILDEFHENLSVHHVVVFLGSEEVDESVLVVWDICCNCSFGRASVSQKYDQGERKG